MLTRVAIFKEAVEANRKEAFLADVHARLEPIWRSLPRVLDVRVLRTRQSDPAPSRLSWY